MTMSDVWKYYDCYKELYCPEHSQPEKSGEKKNGLTKKSKPKSIEVNKEFADHANQCIQSGVELINRGLLKICRGRAILGKKAPKQITVKLPKHPSIAEVSVDIEE